MTWLWNPSVSADVVAYIVYLCVVVTPSQPSPWVEIVETPLLTYTHVHPGPPPGACYIYDVEARDGAGNESVRD
jgi:hypothetical protein